MSDKFERAPAVTKPQEGSYKGHPLMVFPNPDDPANPGVQMGLKKLRAVLAFADEARAFIAKHTAPPADKAASLMALLKARGVSDADIAAALM